MALAALGAGGFLMQAPGAQPSSAVDLQIELAPEKQKHIWDLEHASFVIETYFGKPFTEALRVRDRERLLAAFRPEFQGEVLPSSGGVRREAGLVSELLRSVAETAPLRSVDAAGFVDQLLGYLTEFVRIERARLQVMHVELVERKAGRWTVEFLLTAGGSGAGESPMEHVSRHRAELRYADDDEVKRGKAILTRFRTESVATRTATRKLMEEVTEQVGLDKVPLPDNWKLPTRLVRTHRYQFAVEDYDRDGYPDIAVSATNGRPLLLHSVGGKSFEDVTEAIGLQAAYDSPKEKMLNALVGWIDYDNDGFPDLLMGYRLYHNDSGKRFVHVAKPGLHFDRSPFGCVVADFDGDGRLDLYIVNQKGFRQRPPGKRPWVGDTQAGTENHLWHNEGGGRFRNITAEAAAGGGRHQTFAGVPLYLDDDPYPDLYLANDFGANVLLRNRGDGTFEDVTGGSGTGDFSTSMGVSAGDLDNDGKPELYVANMYSKMGRRVIANVDQDDYLPGLYDMIRGSLAGNRLYRLAGDGVEYEEVSETLGVNQVGWAFAPAMVDLDADGWLDLYATTGFNSADRNKPDG